MLANSFLVHSPALSAQTLEVVDGNVLQDILPLQQHSYYRLTHARVQDEQQTGVLECQCWGTCQDIPQLLEVLFFLTPGSTWTSANSASCCAVVWQWQWTAWATFGCKGQSLTACVFCGSVITNSPHGQGSLPPCGTNRTVLGLASDVPHGPCSGVPHGTCSSVPHGTC